MTRRRLVIKRVIDRNVVFSFGVFSHAAACIPVHPSPSYAAYRSISLHTMPVQLTRCDLHVEDEFYQEGQAEHAEGRENSCQPSLCWRWSCGASGWEQHRSYTVFLVMVQQSLSCRQPQWSNEDVLHCKFTCANRQSCNKCHEP